LLEQDKPSKTLSSLLTPTELEIFRGFRYDKRRQEWLGGRVAAKQAVQMMFRATRNLSLPFQDFSILPNEHGRPQITRLFPGLPTPSISISHSGGFAAALACPEGYCGVDIQLKNPTLLKVQERFASEEELAAFSPVLSLLTRLGLLWTAKEAVKKCLLADHSSFFGAIRLTSVHHEPQEGIWNAHCNLSPPHHSHATVRIGAMGEYLIACAWGERYA
jgi:phosphopantetheinyl transferase